MDEFGGLVRRYAADRGADTAGELASRMRAAGYAGFGEREVAAVLEGSEQPTARFLAGVGEGLGLSRAEIEEMFLAVCEVGPG